MEKINVILDESWREVLKDEFDKPYFISLKAFLLQERLHYKIFPLGSQIFNAFNLTPFNEVKVVIIGQDPYHGTGQAHGLCFSVPQGIKKPPSLVNIFKELKQDLGILPPQHGNLESWANQGVLLLNATLTVRENQPGSHQKKGWEDFTNAAIISLSEKREGLIFVLWGNYAIDKKKLIDSAKHHILTAAHPSPFSAYNGFYGCRHFSKVNEILAHTNKKPIDWKL